MILPDTVDFSFFFHTMGSKGGDHLFLVAFYSPKRKSGVTETSLSVFKWFNENTNLSTVFISFGTLQFEEKKENIFDQFASFTSSEQKRKLDQTKKQYDLAIIDFSSSVSIDILPFLPIVDRLFLVGEEHVSLAQQLQRASLFNHYFDVRNKNQFSSLKEENLYILKDEKEQKVGFMESKNDVEDISKMIYNDYSLHSLNISLSRKHSAVLKKVKKMDSTRFVEEVYQLGLPFSKAILFDKFVFLRTATGQSREEAIEELFLFVFEENYEIVLARFHAELQISQINFRPQNH